MLTAARRTELHKHLEARWLQRKDAAHELLTKYGGNLPHCAVLQVGSLNTSMSVADLIRHTGERFLKEMMASPASNGIVTISITESNMPAARLAFGLMDFNVQQHVGEEELCDLKKTLHYCDALHIWGALTASFSQPEVCIHEFFAVIQSWIRRMKTKSLSEIHFPDGQAQGYVISRMYVNNSHNEEFRVCIIPVHPCLDFSLNLMTVYSTRVACLHLPWQLR